MTYKFVRYELSVSKYPAGLQALLSWKYLELVPVLKGTFPMDRPRLNGSPQFDSGATPEGWTHGHAALLLVEALMHALLEKGVISREEFVDTVDGAAEVERDLVEANASSPLESTGSLLYPLATAFRQELGR